jgi:hypothetical protein
MVVICILKALNLNFGLSTGRTEYSDKIIYFLCFILRTVYFPSLSLYSSPPNALPRRQSNFTRRTCGYCLANLKADGVLFFPCNKFTVPLSLIIFYFFLLFCFLFVPLWVQKLRQKPSIRHCSAMPHPVILWVTSLGKTRK